MTQPLAEERVLGLETSTRVCSVAVSVSGRVVAEQTWDSGLQHAERLLPMAQDMLHQLNLQTRELTGVAVGAGPGSFTGVRIGLATAKGLCLGSGLPLASVPTLAALAYPVWGCGVPVCALLDARRQEVYAGVYEFEGLRPVAVLADQAVVLTDLLPHLPRPVLLVGEGACLHQRMLEDALGDDARFPAGGLIGPGAGAVALIGAEMVRRGNTCDLAATEPTYLRRSQAERVRESRLERARADTDG